MPNAAKISEAKTSQRACLPNARQTETPALSEVEGK